MLIFQPPVNFCYDENIQTIFGTKARIHQRQLKLTVG
jgi:hypothetical protein